MDLYGHDRQTLTVVEQGIARRDAGAGIDYNY